MPVFDQRVAALVRLKGTDVDCKLFEAACEQRGWELLDLPPHPAPCRSDDVSYRVEVRIPGARTGATHAATVKLEDLGGQLVLDLRVEAAEAVDRDPVPDQSWAVYAPRQSESGGSRLSAWRDKRERRAVDKGRRDTGRMVRAKDEADALRKARVRLPGTPSAPAGLRVRKSGGSEFLAGRRTQRRSLLWLIHVYLANIVFLSLVRDHPVAWVAEVGVFIVCVRASLPLRNRSKPQYNGSCSGMMVWGISIWWGLQENFSPLGPLSPEQGALLGGLYAAGVGLRHLVRTWSWREWGPWLIPVLFPVLLGFFPGVGYLVHTFYLGTFDLATEDVDVPRLQQFAASAKVVAVMSLWLLAPALWGYLKHFHVVVQDRWLYSMMTVWLALSVFITAPVRYVADPASAAGKTAQATAKRGDTPDSYFGIKPEWVCLSALTDSDQLPSQGGILRPSRPYLLLGDANGIAALWDREDETALKIPLNKIRVVPQPHPQRPCTA
ncbi:hypothetical protein [Streptomyces sp. NPDC001948]